MNIDPNILDRWTAYNTEDGDVYDWLDARLTIVYTCAENSGEHLDTRSKELDMLSLLGWSTEEKAAYVPLNTPLITQLYQNAGLSMTDPEERAYFLFKKLDMAKMVNIDYLTTLAINEGNHMGLNWLEGQIVSIAARLLNDHSGEC